MNTKKWSTVKNFAYLYGLGVCTAKTTGMSSLPIRVRARLYARSISWLVAAVLFTAFLLTGSASASVRGYVSSDGQSIQKGMVVGLATDADRQPVAVQKSSLSRADKTIGVVVELSSDVLAQSDAGSKVYVANSGVATTFATDLNGNIKKGDLLAVSPIRGVLMRATEGNKGVLGVAVNDLKQEGAETVKLDGEQGSLEAHVAPTMINMDVKFVTATNGNSTSALQRLGQVLVGREVSTIQVLIAMVIIGLVILVEGGVIYATVSSTILSLGRNPFARKAILRTMTRIIALCAVVLVLGVVAVYLVLWL